MSKHSHEDLDAVFATYDQLDYLPDPTVPQSVAAHTKRAARRTMHSQHGRRPSIEHLEARHMMSADPIIFYVDNSDAGYNNDTPALMDPSSLTGNEGSADTTEFSNAAGAKATWTETLSTSGSVQVEAYVPIDANSSPATIYTIKQGSTTLGTTTVDQRTGGWLDLGTYDAEAGNITVEAHSPNHATMRTDSVRLIPALQRTNEAVQEFTDAVLAKQNSIPVVRGITTEQVLQSHAAKVSDLEGRVQELTTHQTTLTASVAATNNRLTTLQQNITDIDAELADQTYREAIETLDQDPSITVQVNNERSAYVHYQNMPGVLSAQLLKNGAVMKTVPIPEGDGSVNVSPWGMGKYAMQIVRSDTGEVLSNPYNFEVAFRGVIKRYSEPSQTLTRVRQELPDAMDAETLAAKQAAKAAAEAEIPTLNNHLAELQAAQATLNDTTALLQRECIPYSRLHVDIVHVNYDEVKFAIRIQSPLTKVKVEVAGESPRTLENPNGIADQTITMERHRDPNYGNAAPVRITLTNPNNNDEILDMVEVAYNQDARTAGILTQQQSWEVLEAGKLRDEPLAPEQVAPVQVAGRTVLLQTSSNLDTTIVRFADVSGSFSSQTLEHSGGTTSNYVTLTLPADQVSKTIEMVHPKTGAVLATTNLEYDAGNKALQLRSDVPSFQPVVFSTTNSGALLSAQASVDAFVEELVVQDATQDYFSQVQTAIQGPNMDLDIENITAQNLLEASQYFITINQANEMFYQTHPQFIEANIIAESYNHSNPAGYQDNMRMQRSDYLDVVSENTGLYNDLVRDMFSSQINLILHELGKTTVDPINHQNAINVAFDERLYAPKIQELRTLITVPDITRNSLQAEVEALFQENIHFVTMGQAAQTRRDAREWNEATREAREAEARERHASDWNDYWTTQIYSDAAGTFFRSFTDAEWQRAKLSMTPSQWNEVAYLYYEKKNSGDTGGEDIEISQEDQNRINTAKANLLSTTSPDDRMNIALSWKDNYQNVLLDSAGTEIDLGVRTDTAVGRLFTGLVSAMWANKSDRDALADLSVITELVTNIPAKKVFHRIEGYVQHDSPQGFISELGSLFSDAQYAHILQDFCTEVRVESVATDKLNYSIGEMIKMRFDVALQDKEMSYAELLAPDGTVIVSSVGHLFFEFPAEALNSLSENMVLTVRVHLTDNSVVGKDTQEFTVKEAILVQGLSVDGNVTHDKILSFVSQARSNFVFGSPISEWYQLLGSGAHDGNSFNAIDFNRIDEGESAGNENVYSIAEGDVVFVDPGEGGKSSVVVVQHNIDGQIFYLKHLHMTNIQVSQGDHISKDVVLGTVWNVGTNGVHLHTEILQDRYGESIDSRVMLHNYSIQVTAWAINETGDLVNQNPLVVEWDSGINSWINTQYNLIYDRSDQVSQSSNHTPTRWLAYHSDPDKREEVILSSGTVDGNQVTGWFNLNNTLFWDGEKWINI